MLRPVNRSAAIRILDDDTNRRGDLFGLLMGDLFIALGYESPQLNIHKSGREVDITAQHRLEPRFAIGECKATVTPVGGDDINKFVGVLDAERKGRSPVTGYYISLAGFKETAVEQEKQGRRTPILLLDGEKIVTELVRGRIIISVERATELAGRCCSTQDSPLVLDPKPELLAHHRGWMWCVFYTQGKTRTHFVLVHSDGTLLSHALVSEVVAADQSCNGVLHQLACLNPAPSSQVQSSKDLRAALDAYQQYLETECGYVYLDGLPADGDIGSRRLRLENLFVPLHLDLNIGQKDERKTSDLQPFGKILSQINRLALLAPPGGGKSTLLKRLAVAYADPVRRREVGDELPDRNWLPLFFRCRELRDMARRTFAELIDTLSQREPVRQYSATFRAYMDSALSEGRVLLLVDGLDEISDPGDRAAFVCTIRAALYAYPGTALVVTSREAGFRHVASHLAPVCTPVTISSFNEEDIRRLSVAWHREVLGDHDKVRLEAEELAVIIARNDRIRQLAINPLLLTTLFLVRRWAGSLPTRRAVLYGKAVEVLLMTWNTEGHDPISQEEALPQLCYVASAMMFKGSQRISRSALALLLQEARDALPTELGYVQGTVAQFIHRVEDRSSLMMMTGHEVEAGHLVEFFEFRHLTFQEYLAALALTRGWHPGRREQDTLAGVLRPYIGNPKWSEVICLAAVLGGKETEGLIQILTAAINRFNPKAGFVPDEVDTLARCLADEAAARPETIRIALAALIRNGHVLGSSKPFRILARGRYGHDFKAEAQRAFLSREPDLLISGQVLGQAVWWQSIKSADPVTFKESATQYRELLRSREMLSRCEGALGVMHLCFELRRNRAPQGYAVCVEVLVDCGPDLAKMICSSEVLEQFAGLWALAWLGALRIWTASTESKLVEHLCELWLRSPDKDVRSYAAWALASQPLVVREDVRLESLITRRHIEELLSRATTVKEKTAAIVAAYYRRAFPDEVIALKATALRTNGPKDSSGPAQTLRDLLQVLPHFQ
jgi:hypothetical protein